MGKKASKDLLEDGIYKTKETDVYDVRVWRRIKGKQLQRRRTVRGIMTARKVRQQLRDDLMKEELKKLNGDIPFRDALEQYLNYLEGRVAGDLITRTTFENRRNYLNRYCDVLLDDHITEINRGKIENIVRGEYHPEVKELAVATKKDILKAIRGLFDYHLLNHGRIKINPATGIYFKNDGRKKYPSVMTIDEAEKLLAYVKEKNEYWFQVYLIAIHTGLRSGELYALRWQDVSLETNQVIVRKAYEFKTGNLKSPKNGEERMVPINSTIKVLLGEMKLKSTGEFVFERRSRWEKGLQANILKRFQREAEVKQTKFHSLRAFFITHLLRSGESAVKVQEIVAHSDYRTTAFYVAMAGTELQNATEGISDIGRSLVYDADELEAQRRKKLLDKKIG